MSAERAACRSSTCHRNNDTPFTLLHQVLQGGVPQNVTPTAHRERLGQSKAVATPPARNGTAASRPPRGKAATSLRGRHSSCQRHVRAGPPWRAPVGDQLQVPRHPPQPHILTLHAMLNPSGLGADMSLGPSAICVAENQTRRGGGRTVVGAPNVVGQQRVHPAAQVGLPVRSGKRRRLARTHQRRVQGPAPHSSGKG